MNRVLSFCSAAIVVALVSCGARTDLDTLISADESDAAFGDASSDADADASLACVPGDIPLTVAEPEVMFVLDRSGSMNTAFSGSQSRWQVLTTALAATLPPVDSSMAIGALIFPAAGSSQDNCTVPSSASLSPALQNVTPLLSLLQSTTPNGATPTADAIDEAASLMLQIRAATTARALVLATDGAPNCNSALDPSNCTCANGTTGRGCRRDADQCLDDTRAVARIAAASGEGIPTYVIGIADSNDSTFSDVLNAMAQAGGRPSTGTTSYYPARSESDLEAAITAIRNQVGACTYLTASVPNAAGSITLTLGGNVIPFDASAKNGWSWANEANGQILLYGSICDAVAGQTNPALVAHVTCGDDGGTDARADAEADADADAELDADFDAALDAD